MLILNIREKSGNLNVDFKYLGKIRELQNSKKYQGIYFFGTNEPLHFPNITQEQLNVFIWALKCL